jgi:alpha-tubulin suppressor-like RCC1 family protein
MKTMKSVNTNFSQSSDTKAASGSKGRLGFSSLRRGALPLLFAAMASLPMLSFAANGEDSEEEIETPETPLTPINTGGLSQGTLITTGAGLADQRAYVWGFRGSSQQGNGKMVVSSKAPIARVESLKNIVSLTGGAYHLLALDKKGNVYGWGQSGYGETGCAPTQLIYVSTPCTVLKNAVQVAAGEYFSIALDNKGRVWTWGHNLYGQLGDGGKKNSQVPVQVNLQGETARLIGAAYEGAFAVTDQGHVWAWGDNEAHGLGFKGTNYGVQKIIRTPTQVPNLSRYAHDIVHIAGGNGWGEALLKNGRVIGWGLHAALGQGTTKTNISSPEPVLVLTGVKKLFARYVGSFALTEDGKLYTWGQTGGSAFKMIYGASPTLRTPKGKVIEIGGGKEHLFYKTDKKEVYGVGYNDLYKLNTSKLGSIIDWPGALTVQIK